MNAVPRPEKPAPDKQPQRTRKRAPTSGPRAPTFRRRLKAAGLDRDAPGDIDAVRGRLARRIHMLINDWHGCPLRACRRQRGCMAPGGVCANVQPGPPASREELARVKAEFLRAIQDEAERRAAEEGGGQ